MTLVKHELWRERWTLAIWTVSIAALMVICIFLYPEMKDEMDSVTELFASMGAFTAAFGMDRLNFGTFIGFYAVECGNILGLGGAFFACLIAIGVLVKEEKDRTAEFLLTHPISRTRVVTEKLISILLQITVLNVVVLGLAVSSVLAIGEEIPLRELGLLHLAYYLLQIELTGICFGLSAFLRRGGLGMGIGLVAVMYFLNLVANISDGADFLKYITPFGYAEGADIVANVSLDTVRVTLGMLFAALGVITAYQIYGKKDIY